MILKKGVCDADEDMMQINRCFSMDREQSEPLLSNQNSTDYSTMKKSSGDPMIRDKKALPYAGNSVIVIFLFFLTIVTPLWLFVLVPLTIVFQVLIKVTGLFVKSPRDINSLPSTTDADSLFEKRQTQKETERIYDVVVFGATGFTGKMSAVYLAKKYGDGSVKWAIAGRRRDALENLRNELTTINSRLKDLPIVIADSSDSASLDAMTARTKVVITTAGPFAKYGSDLVKWCAVNGTHYCDITGETDWSRQMVDQFDSLARKSGAMIVNFCGHDCIPWDLTVLECAKQLKKKGEAISEIRFYDEINANASGGTLDTVFHALGNRVAYKSLLGFDPLLKTPSGEKSTNKFIVANQSYLGYSSEFKAWVGPFVMAAVMANCVRRSNAVNNYSSKLVYKEAAVYPSFMAGYVSVLGLLVFATALFCPPASWFLRTFVLPKPGQGPSEATMDEGFLRVTGVATGSSGSKARAVFYFPTDPGYRDTARMLVESGLVLALQADKIKVGGGIWTPAICQGELLTQRLVDSGSSLTVD